MAARKHPDFPPEKRVMALSKHPENAPQGENQEASAVSWGALNRRFAGGARLSSCENGLQEA